MVYITSGLFGRDPAQPHYCTRPNPPRSPSRSYMADTPAAGLGKRKRRAEDDNEGPSAKHISLSLTDIDGAISGSFISLSRSPAADGGPLKPHDQGPASHEPTGQRTPTRIPRPFVERRPIKLLKRTSPKVSLSKTPSHLMDIEADVLNSTPFQRADTHARSDLRSCHACGTAPKRRRDLENYLDCRRCEERTCYICARKCSSCSKELCRDCVVELGQDGDPWCLECYQQTNT